MSTCPLHGGRLINGMGDCVTDSVLSEIREERARQFARYGDNADLEDGTGPMVSWLWPMTAAPAKHIETTLRLEYERFEERNGRTTWTRLIREEVAEAFVETDPARLREELLQVAALAVSWIEKIDARGMKS